MAKWLHPFTSALHCLCPYSFHPTPRGAGFTFGDLARTGVTSGHATLMARWTMYVCSVTQSLKRAETLP